MKKLFIVLIFLSQIVFAQSVKFKIFETSDVHGNIFPYDFLNDIEIDHSLLHLNSYIKETRKNNDVVLLDNGDFLQGTPLVYYYNFEKTNVENIYATIMNEMAYDAVSVGNHDIETGHLVYDKFAKELKAPFLAANAVNIKTQKPYFEPYTIINKCGVKIAVLGLITPAIPNWLPKQLWEGMYFDDMVESAQKWINIIKQKEHPDLIIGLFHSGVDYKYNGQNKDTYKNENGSKLVAEKVVGFDLIFVGHDHKEWNFKIKNPEGKDVLIMGPSSSARSMVEVDVKMEFDKASKSWIKEFDAKIVRPKNKVDEELFTKYQSVVKEVRNYVNKQVGEFTKTIEANDAFWGSNYFVDLIHQFQLETTKANISFAAPLSFGSEIQKGKVFVRDMFKLYKYENFLYTMELTGKEIKDYLEFSYANWFNTMENENDYLLSYKKDENGKVLYDTKSNKPILSSPMYNYSSAAGIAYTVDISKKIGERVSINKLSNNNEFDMNKKYKVAINSYRGNGGGGHLTLGSGIKQEDLADRVIHSTENDLRFYLMKWIESKKIINPIKYENWKIIPENYFLKGKEREIKYITNAKD